MPADTPPRRDPAAPRISSLAGAAALVGLALVASLVLPLAGCGDGDDPGAPLDTTTPAPATDEGDGDTDGTRTGDDTANDTEDDVAEPFEWPDLELVELWDGFDQPLQIHHDGTGRLYVVEKAGRVWRVEDDVPERDRPFLDISDMVSTESERGLLSIEFSPDFAEDGVFYVDYTDRDGTTHVARGNTDPDTGLADPDSLETLLTVEQPYPNHNGGLIRFGPDGYLYVGLGDGGSAGDPENDAQDLSTLLGTLLRIDVTAGGEGPYAVPDDNPFVDTPDARPEIWAYGLRNPWRFSFDRETGDLYIADVGQDEWEEIDFEPASSVGGRNYGWSRYEGTHVYDDTREAPDAVMPVYEYGHDAGGSVTGGYVYRGSEHPGLAGVYLFADFESGRIWGLRPTEDGWEAHGFTDTDLLCVSFGEDTGGELYLVDFRGSVYSVRER